MSIEVANSLIPGLTDTPLDARSRVAALSDIVNVANPFLGMEIFCTATGKTYKVKSLKSKVIGSMTVANAAVEEYEEIPDAETFADLTERVTALEEDGGGSPAGGGSGMLYIANSEALVDVTNPRIGQHIYLIDPGKEVIVTAIAEGVISGTEDAPTRANINALELRVENIENNEDEPIVTSISTLMLPKPKDGLFLIIRKAGSDGTMANSTVVIDTLNVAEDRKKVKGFLPFMRDGVEDGYWTVCPDDGFIPIFDDNGVAVDLSAITDLPCTLFYCWATDAETFSDWQSVIYPCYGGGSGSSTGGTGSSTGSSADRMALFCLCTEEPPTLFDGLIWVQGGTSEPQYIPAPDGINVLTEDTGNYTDCADGTIILNLN